MVQDVLSPNRSPISGEQGARYPLWSPNWIRKRTSLGRCARNGPRGIHRKGDEDSRAARDLALDAPPTAGRRRTHSFCSQIIVGRAASRCSPNETWRPGAPSVGFHPWPRTRPGPQMTLPPLVLPRPGDFTGASEVSQASAVLRCPAAASVRPYRGIRSRIISRRACRPYGRRDVAPPPLHCLFRRRLRAWPPTRRRRQRFRHGDRRPPRRPQGRAGTGSRAVGVPPTSVEAVGRISQRRNPTSFNPFPYRKGRQGAHAPEARTYAIGVFGTGTGVSTGNATRTVVPCVTRLSMRSPPPWARTMCLTMANPRPVPPSSRDRALSTR